MRDLPVRRLPAALVLALTAVLGLPPPSAAQQSPPPYEQGIFEIRIPRLPTSLTVSVLVDDRGRLLLPLAAVLEYAGIPTEAAGTTTVVVRWPAPAFRTELDLAAGARRRGPDVRALDAAEWARYEETVYVAPAVLADLLGAEVAVDWSNLTVALVGDTPLPALASIEREARREIQRRVPGTPDRDTGVPYPARSGGVVLSWGVSSLAGPDVQTTARSTLGTSLLGGQVELGGTLGFGSTSGDAAPFARYLRGFPNGRWLRQLRVGDIITDGVVSRGIRGVAIGNAPLLPRSYFGEVLVAPVIPTGWEYEVYQGDYLLGVARADEPGAISAPLRYGNTSVTIRAYGPSGQETVQELVFLTPATLLPARELQYSAGGGACVTTACRSYGYGDIRYGVSARATVGAGADRLVDSAGSVLRPFALVSVAPFRQLSIEARAQAHTLARVAAQYMVSNGGSVQGSLGWSDPRGEQGDLESGPGLWYGDANATGRWFGRWVSGGLRAERADSGGIDGWRGSLASTFGRSYAWLGYERGTQRETLVSARIATRLPTLGIRALREPAVSGGISLAGREPNTLEIGASARGSASSVVQADVRWRRGSASPTFSVGLVGRTPWGYLQTRGSGGAGARASAFIGANGGLSHAPGAGLVPLPSEGLGQAGVVGTVFYDANGNGVRDPGDEPAPGIPVLAAGHRVQTDARGVFHSWSLTPYEVAVVRADTLGFDDPSWVPLRRSSVLRPTPHRYARVDIPLVRTREVSGMLVPGPGVGTAGGVALELVATGDDSTAAVTIRTFSDGEFYIGRLAPGEYELSVADASLRALGAVATPARLRFTVPSAGEATLVEIPPILLQRPVAAQRPRRGSTKQDPAPLLARVASYAESASTTTTVGCMDADQLRRCQRAASRTSYLSIVRRSASSRSTSSWLASTTTTNRMSANSSATSPSGSSGFLVFGPKRWLSSRASSPISSARRARLTSGGK